MLLPSYSGEHSINLASVSMCFNNFSSTIAGPTFSGFIVGQGLPWPVEYWYNVGLEGLCIVLIVLFLEETGFTRPGKPLVYPRVSDSRMARLIDAHFFRKPIVVQRTAAEMVR